MAHYDGELLVERIRDICRKKQISIAQMEKELKWSQGLISRWTKNSPSIGKIMEVVSYLGVSYEELLGEGDSEDEENDGRVETLFEKLYRTTEMGKLIWEVCDDDFDNIDVQSLLRQNENEGCKIYYTPYEKGFFLLILKREDKETMEIGVLRNHKARVEYQDPDTEEWLEELLELIDQEEYEEWNKLKTKYYVEQFMRTDFS